VITDRKIPREHALIIIEKNGFYIEDQNSPSEIYVKKNDHLVYISTNCMMVIL